MTSRAGSPETKAETQAESHDAYARALERVQGLALLDSAAIAPECRTQLLAHGAASDTAIVLLHGMTNCPAQFLALARACHERGANVLLPRLPRHGYADRSTDALAGSDAAEFEAFMGRVVDAASGLGRRLVVSGLSLGGTLAAWAGQGRAEVERVVLIAPLLALPRVPWWASPPIGQALAVLPNAFLWWDRKKQANLAGPTHVYPRFATRAVAASVVCGARVLSRARLRAPACASAAFVTLEDDPAVGNSSVDALARRWRRKGCAVVEHRFERRLELNHDLVDPDQVGARVDLTYPVLLDLLGV